MSRIMTSFDPCSPQTRVFKADFTWVKQEINHGGHEAHRAGAKIAP